MGQKINPVGFRMGITKTWTSKWFTNKREYGKYVAEDYKVRKYLEKKFEAAGVKDIQIERSPNEIKVTIRVFRVSKPGVVIGKGGAGVTEAQDELKRITKAKVSLTAEEIKTPEVEASLVAQYIARQLKRRIPYRRIMNTAVQSAMDKGAKGVRIKLAGLLGGGSSIARVERLELGSIPAQTLRADIDFAQLDCHMLYGTIGIKVWIYKGEVEL
jgi:small subunit ribosomal protein S3